MVLIFSIVLVVFIVMIPFIGQSQQKTERIFCAANLQEIGKAMYIYAKEHNGKFPSTLQTLYDEKYLADPRYMDCPATKIKGTVEFPEYEYAAGMSVDNPSMDYLVQDKPGNHRGRDRNILTVNGTVIWGNEDKEPITETSGAEETSVQQEIR